ncbi:MAG TPA: glycerophosphodiester phosphodiesterase family protein [Bacteroidales bacterium]|nr:glycerophosphodiester phosphodiesterase family protein [Bacteroidales bacterium]
MKQKAILILSLIIMTLTCYSQVISPTARRVQSYLPENAVIAHRGTIYWAPELTEASFRWARNAGADYLELDVQRSNDGVLIIMHDKTFKRTTDVSTRFPGRENDPVSSFTCAEIIKLDAGSSFNSKNPDQARAAFTDLNVLVLEDAFRIAEGKRIKRGPDGSRIISRDSDGKPVFEYEPDPADNDHRPGVYIEFKIPEEYPGIEEQVYKLLASIGWNPLEGEKISDQTPFYLKGKVNTGNTNGKILVQTFSREGMYNLKRVFKEAVPCSFLISNPKTNDFVSTEVMDEIISFAIGAGAQFIGTNLGDSNDGLTPLFSKKIHEAGLKSNVYSFNTIDQMEKYFGPAKGKKAAPLADGMITNRSELTIDMYHNMKVRKLKNVMAPSEILDVLGYNK